MVKAPEALEREGGVARGASKLREAYWKMDSWFARCGTKDEYKKRLVNVLEEVNRLTKVPHVITIDLLALSESLYPLYFKFNRPIGHGILL